MLTSCAFTMSDTVQIVKINEMETIKDIENIKFTQRSNIDNLDINYLKSFKNLIKEIKLYEISKWAKKEMKDYKIPDNFIDNLNLEGFYKKNNEDITYFFRSIELPSHTPLVKRFLYIGYNFKKNKLEKIIITIQGYAEE
jgi:DNA-directed RNA polymerase specialized sigma54-like protein